MEFVPALRAAEVPPGTLKAVTVRGKEVLIANVDGVFCALNNKCPHLGGNLAQGKLESGVVTCPRHKAQFDVRTGAAVGKAQLGPLKLMPKNAARYEVKVEGPDVLVQVP